MRTQDASRLEPQRGGEGRFVENRVGRQTLGLAESPAWKVFAEIRERKNRF